MGEKEQLKIRRSLFNEAALPSARNVHCTHTPCLFRTREALLFSQLWVLPARTNSPHTCFRITVLFFLSLFTVNNYVYFSEWLIDVYCSFPSNKVSFVSFFLLAACPAPRVLST